MNFISLGLNLQNLSLVEYRAMTKAKKLYVKYHPECAVCGYKKKLEVHHCIPVHIDKNLASNHKNLITLCDSCHFTWGHFGNYRTKYNAKIREFAILTRSYLEKLDRRHYDMTTDDLIKEFAANISMNENDFRQSLEGLIINLPIFNVLNTN